jgi:hypothetical protein
MEGTRKESYRRSDEIQIAFWQHYPKATKKCKVYHVLEIKTI